jgi:hypothetical protein
VIGGIVWLVRRRSGGSPPPADTPPTDVPPSDAPPAETPGA